MSDEIKVQSKNKKTMLIVAIAAAVIVVLTIVAIVLASSNSATAQKVKEQLSLGEKYLSELQYEQAIAAYELAIEIDPKSVDAYLGLAEVYEEMGEFDKAIEVLEEAKAVVGDEEALGRIEEKRKDIEEKKQEASKPVAPLKDLVVETDYFKASQDSTTGKITLTLTGLTMQDSYTINKSTSFENCMEYGWTMMLRAENYAYEIGTTSWARYPGREEQRDLADMQHDIWEYNVNDMSASVVGDVEMQYTSDSITWIVLIPEGHRLDLAEVNEYWVEVVEDGEKIIDRREYLQNR